MLKKQKNPYQWENITALAVMGFFCLSGLVTWIVTSWYSIDLNWSQTFYQGMDHKFIRAWSAFTVLDGYEGVVTFIFPMLFIVIESLFLSMKKTRPHGWFAHHQASFTWFYMLLAGIWTVGLLIESVLIFFSDKGFGWGFDPEFQVGWRYLIPAFVLSLTIQLTYLWLATWYVHWHLAKRSDFMTNQYWKRACVVMLTIGFLYIPIAFFKAGFRRVYYWNITFGDILKDLEKNDPDRFYHYLGQTKYNYGFNPYNKSLQDMIDMSFWSGLDPTKVNNKFIYNMPDLDYPWYEPFGFFTKNPILPKDSISKKSAFPSGHMAAAFGMGMTVYIFKDDQNKKVVLGRRIGFVLAILYPLDMAFALQVSLSHWWSDIAFTMFWLGPATALAWWVVQLVADKLLPKIHNSLSRSK